MHRVLPKEIDDTKLTYGTVSMDWPNMRAMTHLEPGADPDNAHWTDLSIGADRHGTKLQDIDTRLWLSTVRSRGKFVTGLCLEFPCPSPEDAIERLATAYDDIANESSAVRPLTDLSTAMVSPDYSLEAHQKKGITRDSVYLWMTGRSDISDLPFPTHMEMMDAQRAFSTVVFAATALCADVCSRTNRTSTNIRLSPYKNHYPWPSALYRPPRRRPDTPYAAPSRLDAIRARLFPTTIPGDDRI